MPLNIFYIVVFQIHLGRLSREKARCIFIQLSQEPTNKHNQSPNIKPSKYSDKPVPNPIFPSHLRIRIILTSPRPRPSPSAKRLHNPDNRPISPSNSHKRASEDDKTRPSRKKHPQPRPIRRLAPVPVIIEPHTPSRLVRQERTEQGTDKRDEVVEDWDPAGNYICYYCAAECTGYPGCPVD